MNIRTKTNGIVFILMLSIPLVAEVITAESGNVPGTGFSVLLYEPFDFAYTLLTLLIFVFSNLLISKKQQSPLSESIATSVGLFILWFVISFLSVMQLHLSLGGTL